ncbi:MAG TPA: hypothetical protein PLL32_01340, partial [Anaeromyxobacteraceae bacterium]|nr:hypothetical protein [Anaeromyxobacteraceae bacterium]
YGAVVLEIKDNFEVGPRIQALPQVIVFGPAPTPAVNQATATVTATASSGLPVRYSSRTPALCAIDPSTGLVTASSSGPCTVAANQPGDATFAAAPQVTQDVTFRFQGLITFQPAPAMAVHDLATVSATESAGLPVTYAASTPATCAVDARSGVVAAVAAGDCTVVASAGDAQASLTFPVAPPPAPSAPSAPSIVGASAGGAPGTVLVSVGAVQAGGSPITGWEVTSTPPGVTGSGNTNPFAVACPDSCSGYRLSVTAVNAMGSGSPSAPASIVTAYAVVATFREPDTQPNDTIFEGTYVYDASAGTVSGLAGRLSEAMTGGPTPYPDDTMTWVELGHPLSSIPVVLDGEAGWLVTTFHLPVTDTFTSDPKFGGTDGWAPGSGGALHSGFPGANPGNAYARIFVRASDPSATPTQGQIDRMAYADCAPGGMMGSTCMTGTSVAGYGTVGSMGGYPVAQVTSRR